MKLLFLSFIFISTSLFAQKNMEYRPCFNHETQKESMGITIDYGDYQGLCFNDQMMKPVLHLETPDFLNSNDFVVVKNFSHKGSFFVALIDLTKFNSETKVIMQLERFTPKFIAGHTQLRYNFNDKAVKLYKSYNDLLDKKDPEYELDTIITSIEAMRPFGKKYNLIHGTQRKFVAVFRMKSLYDVYEKALINQNDNITQFTINFEHESNKSLLLTEYISKSTGYGYSLEYDTLRFNCTNALYYYARPLIKSVGKDLSKLEKIKLAFPALAPKVLKKANLIDEEIDPLHIEYLKQIIPIIFESI